MRSIPRMVMSVVLGLAVTAVVLVPAVPAAAHPLGNFTTNQHVGITRIDGGLGVRYIVDMAEIPATRTISQSFDDTFSDGGLAAFAGRTCEARAENLIMSSGGGRMPLVSVDSRAAAPAGEAGLVTLRIECAYEVALRDGASSIALENTNYEGTVGWREIVVGADVGDNPGVADRSSSLGLTSYPSGPLLDERTVTFETSGDAGTSPALGDLARSSSVRPALVPEALSQLVQSRAGPWASSAALFGAIVLGVVHALAPGHGKTLMGAYLIGSRGTARHAVGLGVSVALAHTVGVLLLGFVTLHMTSVAPERIVPILTTISAAILVGVGSLMIVRSVRGSSGHTHAGDADHGHHGHATGHHHEFGQYHRGPHPKPAADRRARFARVPGIRRDRHVSAMDRPALTWRAMAAVGLAGGVVPSASAVVLLLGGMAAGDPLFGMMLVLAFGAGMAVTLAGVGMALRLMTAAGLARMTARVKLPHHSVSAVAGFIVVVVGAGLMWSSVTGSF